MEATTLYPTIAKAAALMDCSGGAVFEDALAIERALLACGYMQESTMAAAEAELAALNDDQLTWAAMGGQYSGETYEGEGTEPTLTDGTEAILREMYDLA